MIPRSLKDIIRPKASHLPQVGCGLIALGVAAFMFPSVAVSLAFCGGVAAALFVASAVFFPDPVKTGLLMIGYSVGSGDAVWLGREDMRHPLLVLGPAPRRNDLMMSMSRDIVEAGGGMIFVAGTGDVGAFARLYALARKFGREDDVLVVSTVDGGQPPPTNGTLRSNTLNPFTSGSAENLTRMIVSLMDDGEGGEAHMWTGRAIAMFSALLGALVWKRDHGLLELNVEMIRDHLNLTKIIDLADKEKEPLLPFGIRQSVVAYLYSLPGYNPEKGHLQARTTQDQHGFLQMQFTKILGTLADVYGHIFMTPHPHVDLDDVVANRRILVFLIQPGFDNCSTLIANMLSLHFRKDQDVIGHPGNAAFSDRPFAVMFDDIDRFDHHDMDYFCRYHEHGDAWFVIGRGDVKDDFFTSSTIGLGLYDAACRIEVLNSHQDAALVSTTETSSSLVRISRHAPWVPDSFALRVNHFIAIPSPSEVGK